MEGSFSGGQGGGREATRLTHDQRLKLKDSMARAERVFRVHKNVWWAVSGWPQHSDVAGTGGGKWFTKTTPGNVFRESTWGECNLSVWWTLSDIWEYIWDVLFFHLIDLWSWGFRILNPENEGNPNPEVLGSLEREDEISENPNHYKSSSLSFRGY